jgi:polyisoprenyl-phosphate glycosyltransferase
MMSNKKLISIVTPCFNEEENVADAYNAIKSIRDTNKNYDWEHLFIDNNSSDNTVPILRTLAQTDESLKVIINIRNYGHLRSPHYALLQANGDAVIIYLCDNQDPADMINIMIKKWEDGKNKIVIGVKETSDENGIIFYIRKLYYLLMEKISNIKIINNYHGFGLYDKNFLQLIKDIKDPYPYFRGLVAEFGSEIIEIKYHQKKRTKGKSKNNIFSLYDMVILGIVAYSLVPLRIISITGIFLSIGSLLAGLFYFMYKMVYWDEFQIGITPLILSMFFFASIQIMFIGIFAEYIGVLLRRVTNHPLVIEKERINF